MKNIEFAKELLLNEGYTLVITNGDTVYHSFDRGVKPLLSIYDSKTDVTGFSAADKVVGRAAAFIYVMLGISQVYASVISESALEILEEHGISTSFSNIVPRIINRNGNGFCPMEEATINTSDPQNALSAIRNKLK